MKKQALCLFTLSLLVAPAGFADNKNKGAISGDLEFGWLATSGNTETSSVKASADIDHKTDNWNHNYAAEVYRSENKGSEDTTGGSDDDITAEKYGISMKNTYKLDSKHAGLFVFSSYEDDRFSGFNYQASLSAGYSNRLFENSNSHFDYSFGPGYSFNEIESNTGETVTDNTLIVRVDLHYQYNFSENAHFEQRISSDVSTDSDETTRTKSITSVKANLNSSMALKASLTITNNSKTNDASIEHTDTQSSVTLVYSF